MRPSVPERLHAAAPSPRLRGPERTSLGGGLGRCAQGAGLALVLVAGCVGPGDEGESTEHGRRGSLVELEELVRKGALQPVEGVLEDQTDLETRETLESDPPSGDPFAGEADQERAEALAEAGELPGSDPEPFRPPLNPWLEFGDRIIVHQDGRITKPFPLPPGRGQALLDLMTLFAEFPIVVLGKDGAGQGSVEGAVEVMLMPNWDAELYQDMRKFPPPEAKPVSMADWLVCTAGVERLQEVEDFINLFAAGVPQIEIEALIVELTESDELDFGIRPVDGSTPVIQFPSNTLVKSLDLNFPNLTSANEALLALGAVQDSVTFNAVLEAVATWSNVEIRSQPKIAVREGGKAEIVNTEDLPFFEVTSINASGGTNTQLKYKEVGIKLYIVPRVVGSDTVALNIDLEASQQVGDATPFVSTGVDNNGQELSVPVIAARTVRTVVYLQPGQAVILGGLTTETKVDSERKTPILGDIPILGWLFKSKYQRTQKRHSLFFIRPRILEGIEFQREF